MRKLLFIRQMLLSAALLMPAALQAQGAMQMPSMPAVSVPTVGGEVYAPGSAGFYGPRSPRASRQSAAAKQESKARGAAPESQKDSERSADLSAVVAAVSQSKSALPDMNPLSSDEPKPSELLTARDISSLGNLGYFRNLSGLLSQGKSGRTPTNSVELEKVLAELDDLKSRVDEKDRSESVVKASFSTSAAPTSKILRFLINNYDVAGTIQTVYFSKEEADGTFLLTGDRLYYADGANRSETFYILFKTVDGDDGITKYKVSASVSQEYENPNSYFFRMSDFSEREELRANRTGNLVTIKLGGDDLKIDMLLGLEK